MKEIHKRWFVELYTKEIEHVKGMLENERVWHKGSATPEQEQIHRENIECLNEYEKQLQEKLNEVQ